MTEPLTSLYIHIPFCSIRCGYCDFNTYAGMQRMIPDYINALQKEISFIGQRAGSEVQLHTIYFGGGTPSLLSIPDIEKILLNINQHFLMAADVEITLEANPNNLDLDYLAGLHRAGINRLSIGVQSMNRDDLRMLDRRHDPFQVISAVHSSRKTGFENISLDLIFGIPGQNLGRWENTLKMATELNPEHLSLYSLTLEDGTQLSKDYNKGYLPLIDEDEVADMYELAMDLMQETGYQQYEISNWARTDIFGNKLASRHNLQYWTNQPYIGVGAGAHSSWRGFRMANAGKIASYIQLINNMKESVLPATPATGEMMPIDKLREMQETMMVGLRLTLDGVSQTSFYARFGIKMEEVFGKEIIRLVAYGLLELVERNGQRCLKLTERGRLLGNIVFREFV